MIQRTLYYARSGNCLRAAIALELSGHPFMRREVELVIGRPSPVIAAHNPAGKLPVYVETGDGADFVLTQSGAIMNHVLRDTQPELFVSAEGRARALVDASVYAAISDIAVQNALWRYMDFDTRNAVFLRERMLRSLAASLSVLASRPFVAGDALSVADVAHYPVVHMRRPLLAMLGGFRHVLAWADRLRDLPSFARAIEYCGVELSIDGQVIEPSGRAAGRQRGGHDGGTEGAP